MFNIFKSTGKKLDEARLKLETDLKVNGMEFLVNTMASDDIYSPLLERKRRTEISGTDNVSWYAYRRAEVLQTDEEKAELLRLLDTPSYEAKKDAIFFCLGHLCRNRTDHALFNLLMKYLESEKDIHCKSSILIGIGDMDKTNGTLNIEPIKQLAKKRSMHIKTEAILALANTNDPEVEPLLMEMFTATKDSHLKTISAHHWKLLELLLVYLPWKKPIKRPAILFYGNPLNW
ncbi:MAG: HEAT repeat domain-containing protein [Cytophaga sp.]|uniref:HEAT repeat domain-containing protein n=1 Tax=Cytophaga sp. TaxID=29535 RepID=UPI003F7DAB10